MRIVTAAGVFLGLAMVAGGAQAEVLGSKHVQGFCLDINMSTKQAVVWNCHGGFNQNFISGYGQMKVSGQCLDTANGSRGGTKQGDALIIGNCTNSRSQKWGFDRASGKFRNEEGWCADIKGGARSQGSPVIAWSCSGASNQAWFTGNVMKIDQARNLPPQSLDMLRKADANINRSGGNIIAAGGGNMVAAGGGNIIAAGGGNIIAGGAGN